MSVTSHTAWQKPRHVETFDAWAALSPGVLRKTYESFNEIRLFVEHEPRVRGCEWVEVGCATGELYRYLKLFHPRFLYTGFDISEAAVHRAREKYPEGAFFVCGDDLSGISAHSRQPDILFSRDVVHHQPSPFEFLSRLLRMPTEAAVLRIRTRDKGASVLDPELSCQRTYDSWVPYMVLNVDEIIDAIQRIRPVESLHIYKHYQILGGRHGRFLPKACYEAETGTAETALYVRFSSVSGVSTPPRIVIESMRDSNPRYSVLDRLLRRGRRAFSKGPAS